MTEAAGSSPLDRIERGYGAVLTTCAVASAVVIGGTLILVTLDVFLRNLFVSGVKGVIEFTEMGLYISTVLAAPWLLRQGEHIKVDLLGQFAPKPVALAADLVSNILGFVVIAIVGWYAFGSTIDSYVTHSVMRRSINIPEWLMLAPLAVSMALLAIEFLFRARASVGRLRHAGLDGTATGR